MTASSPPEARITFWLDFSSPYAYLAAKRILAMPDRAGLFLWQPVLASRVFRHHGMAPLRNNPVRHAYALRDWDRIAAWLKAPFVLPSVYPFDSSFGGEVFYRLQDRDEDLAVAFGQRLFDAVFAEGQDICDEAVVRDLLGDVGGSRGPSGPDILSGIAGERMQAATETAISRGVFGMPFFHVEAEPFWGLDAMDMALRFRLGAAAADGSG